MTKTKSFFFKSDCPHFPAKFCSSECFRNNNLSTDKYRTALKKLFDEISSDSNPIIRIVHFR